MPGIVNIPKVRQIAGGILGEQSKALLAIRDALEGVKGDWPIKIVACGNNSFKVTCQAEEGTGGGIDVAGTPGLFKVVALVGWEKATAESEWSQMPIEDSVSYNPTKLWDEFVDGVDFYPWRGLRPTWDYVRAYEEA